MPSTLLDVVHRKECEDCPTRPTPWCRKHCRTHYGDPRRECRTDELVVYTTVASVNYIVCAELVTGHPPIPPLDTPWHATSTWYRNFGQWFLGCNSSSECGTGAICENATACFYPDTEGFVEKSTTGPLVNLLNDISFLSFEDCKDCLSHDEAIAEDSDDEANCYSRCKTQLW